MEQQLNLLLWVIGGGFGVTFGILGFMWTSLHNRIDRLEQRIDRLDEKMTDIDRRLCRLEGAFTMQQGCALSNDKVVRKAE